MAGRGAARRRARGGDSIQALRQARARVTLALAAALAYAGVFAYSVTREPTLAPLVAPVAAFGALLLVFVLIRRTDDLLGWAILLNGLAYAGATSPHGAHADEAAPLVGLGPPRC